MQTEKPFSGRMTLFGSKSLTVESGVGIPIIIEETGEPDNEMFHEILREIADREGQ